MEMNGRQIVQVTPAPVHPPRRGGHHRMHGLLLGRNSEDTVSRVVHPIVHEKELAEVNIEDGYIEHRTRCTPQLLGSLLTGRLLDAPPVFTSSIMRRVNTEKIDYFLETADVVFVERPWHFDYVESATPDSTPILYSSHNYEPEMYAHLRDGIRSWFVEQVEVIERQAVSDADLTIVTSERDRKKYEQLAQPKRIHVAPNATYRTGLTADRYRETVSPTDYGGNIVIFVGSAHPPNVTAVENIFEIATDPQIANSDVQFFVIGKVADHFDHSPKNVELVGFVDDIAPWYESADAAINPMTEGAGTNIKMVEYFAKGVPVVSTPFGARGIPATPGRHYLEAEHDNMAASLLSFLNSDGKNGIPERAKTLVADELNWEVVSRRLFDQLDSITPYPD